MLLSEEEMAPTVDLRERMEMKMFFLYLTRIIGVEIDAKAMKGLWKSLSSTAAG
jgi:hypothetical protein